MSLFDKIFGKKSETDPRRLYEETYFKGLTLYEPKFTTWDGQLYESELVRASIDAVSRRFAKMNVKIEGAAKPKMQTALRHRPNSWQTWSQMLYRMATILYVQNTCVIVPVLDKTGEILGIYPLLPATCSVKEFNGRQYLRFEFRHGEYAAVELDKCGILTRFQYRSDFFGEGNVNALRPTMELMHIQNQAIETGVKNSASYRFIAQLSNYATDEDLAKERERFTEYNLRQGSGGVLLFPNTYKDIRQVTASPFTVSAEEQKLISDYVYNYFGVNEKILQNMADDDMENAFYAGELEWLAVQTSEVLTAMLFSKTEQSNGSHVELNANRLENMSLKNKLELVKSMIDRGILKTDEVRELFGFDPMDDGMGDKTPIRGEYYFLEDGKPGAQEEPTEEETEEDAVPAE